MFDRNSLIKIMTKESMHTYAGQTTYLFSKFGNPTVYYVALIGNHDVVQIIHYRWRCRSYVTQGCLSIVLHLFHIEMGRICRNERTTYG